MRHFKLTHFDQVWNALSDPANTGLAEAYRLRFQLRPPSGDSRDVAVERLNFLLERCSSLLVERKNLVIQGGAWHLQLPDGRVAQSLEEFARGVVGSRASEALPTVSPGSHLQWLFHNAVATVSKATKRSKTQAQLDGERASELPASGGRPLSIRQAPSNEVNASIPGDVGVIGTGLQQVRSDVALREPAAPLRGRHYAEVAGEGAWADRRSEARVQGLPGP